MRKTNRIRVPFTGLHWNFFNIAFITLFCFGIVNDKEQLRALVLSLVLLLLFVFNFFSCREHIARQMEFVYFSSMWQFQNWELKKGCSKASVERGLYPACATAALLLLYEKLQVN